MVNWERIPSPYISSPYTNIYCPSGQIYKGVDTTHFKNNTYYEKWNINDFCVLKARDGKWHVFGIIHPEPPDFYDSFNFDDMYVHEAENQLFHISFDTIEGLLNGEKVTEHDIVMYPQMRPGEPEECWAPAVIDDGKQYRMFYTPYTMRTAVSDDLFNWKATGSVFDDNMTASRDPFIYKEDNIYYMIYNYDEELYVRQSEDLVNWSEKELFYKNTFAFGSQKLYMDVTAKNVSTESPCFFKRGDWYYLMWCIFDSTNGGYDNRTLVYASKNIKGFVEGLTPIAMLHGHAPEIICENGKYYIFSVFQPENGLNLARIDFDCVAKK